MWKSSQGFIIKHLKPRTETGNNMKFHCGVFQKHTTQPQLVIAKFQHFKQKELVQWQSRKLKWMDCGLWTKINIHKKSSQMQTVTPYLQKDKKSRQSYYISRQLYHCLVFILFTFCATCPAVINIPHSLTVQIIHTNTHTCIHTVTPTIYTINLQSILNSLKQPGTSVDGSHTSQIQWKMWGDFWARWLPCWVLWTLLVHLSALFIKAITEIKLQYTVPCLVSR